MTIVPNIPSNLNPTQLSSLTSSIPSVPNLPSTGSLNKEKIDGLKSQATEKLANLSPTNPADVVSLVSKKSDKTPAELKSTLLAIATPLFLKLINTDAISDRLINTLVRSTTNQLKQKGRVDIQGGTITFTPIQPGNYDIFKQNFDQKVDNLKKAMTSLKKTVDAISLILKFLRIGVSAIRVIRSIIKKKKQTLAKTASAELASPSPIKPTFSIYMATKEEDDDREKDLDKKLEAYTDVLIIVNGMLGVSKNIVNQLQIKINSLNININNQQPATPSTQPLSNTYNTTPGKDSEMDEMYGKYELKVISLPSGAIQGVAYDSFSKMKITQTAPSKLKSADKLIDELKQILG
jgi:hypothetical protein